MRFRIGFLVFFGVFLLNLTASSQSKEELSFIISPKQAIAERKVKSLSIFKNETSELKLAFLGVIRFYQFFISSQDQPVCNFTVSCSRFGISAIKKFGIFHGFLMASDRIQRCNGLGRRYYPIDPQIGLSIDYPVEDYFLGRAKKNGRDF
ncbi:MAG: membrane protein insertion efficiency factor YidD [Acidobacteriota bacterium]